MSISWPFSRRRTQPDAGAADSSRAHAADRTTAARAAGPPRAHPAGGTTSAGAAGPADRTTPARDHEPDTSRAAISVEGLNVDRGGVRVLHDLSFSVAGGERITITGSNGAGKTTLLSTILGLLSPASGSVRVDGMRVGSRTWRRARHIVGYVSQHAVHTDFPISASEVVAIGLSGGAAKGSRAAKGTRGAGGDAAKGDPAASGLSIGARHGSPGSVHGFSGAGAGLSGRREKRRRMHEAMDMAGCAHLAGAAYARLSGGQRQRVSIARCLCQNPRILLLDEPTASLDPEGKETLLSLADRLSQTLGITVLMVSHESSHFERPGWRRLALEAGRIGPDAPGGSPWK